MSTEYKGPRIGDQAVAFSPLSEIRELAVRDRVPGVVLVDAAGVKVWVPLTWLSVVHDARPGGGER